MILIAHIIIALFSLGYTTYLFFSPSKMKLKISYSLVGLTVVSGTYLIVATKSHMIEACTMGLLYLAVTLSGILASQKKLAKQEISI